MSASLARAVAIVGAWLVVAGLALVAACAPARAHDWYPLACCNTADCYQVGDGQREPAPVFTPQGWRLHDGVVVPFAEARPSPDGKFHVCRYGGNPKAGVIVADRRPCVFAPASGS